MAAAQFGFVYSELADLGVYGMAASQLTGYPGNAASISMLDWTNGLGNAWFWVLKMFIDTLGSGLKDVVETSLDSSGGGGGGSRPPIRPLFGDHWVCIHSVSSKAVADEHVDPIYAKALVVHNHTGAAACGGRQREGGAGGGNLKQRVVVLVNTKNCTANVTVPGASGGRMRAVDMSAGYESVPYSDQPISSDTGMVQLHGFGTAIVCLP